jgi:hypothetical protein
MLASMKHPTIFHFLGVLRSPSSTQFAELSRVVGTPADSGSARQPKKSAESGGDDVSSWMLYSATKLSFPL